MPTRIDGTLAYNCIVEIPWEKHPLFAFSEFGQSTTQFITGVLENIPNKELEIPFAEDVWDFNAPKAERYVITQILSFKDFPYNCKDYAKFYALYLLGNKGSLKVSTVRQQINGMKSILTQIYKETNHKTLKLITTDDIKNAIESRSGSKDDYYMFMQSFFLFLKNHYKMDLSIDEEELDKLRKQCLLNKRQSQEDNKWPDIPQEYFRIIKDKCIEIMDDEAADNTDRIIACAILVLSQTGLRINDLLDLKVDSLKCRTLKNSGKEAHYIHYTARKPSRANQPLLEFNIFSSPLCTKAFQKALEIRSVHLKSKYLQSLFIVSAGIQKDVHALSAGNFNYYYGRFFYTHLYDEAMKEWDGITPTKYQYRDYVKHKRAYISLNTPSTPQYRVHVCTELYNKNTSMEYIKRYMGHLSEAMLGYYVRPKDTYQENTKYSEQVIKDIAENDFTPLGGILGNDMKEAIKKFIEDNNFNVKTDIAEIVKAFGDKLIIRGKTGGVCIKTKLVSCAEDVDSNHLLCAYNLCPNLFHFFYMIDVTYENFKTLQQTYQANKENGKRLDAQKELNKLKDICRRKLIPELDELDKELERKGFDFIIDLYPSLIDIIESKDEIRKEIEAWMSK